MPSRKQRRRRQKELRHEYEFVVVDGDGRELDANPAEVAPRRPHKEPARKEPRGKGKTSRRSAGPARVVKPPSWRRSGRRAALFLPLFFLTFSLINHKQPIATRALMSVLYTLLFIPLTYLIDRASFRAYERRLSGGPARGRRR